MRDGYYLSRMKRFIGDPRIRGENGDVLVSFDKALISARLKLATRRGYDWVLNRLGVWLGRRGFGEVDRWNLRDWFSLLDDDGLGEDTITLIQAKLKRFFKWVHMKDLDGKTYPDVVSCYNVKRRGGRSFRLMKNNTSGNVLVASRACYYSSGIP